MRGLLFTKLRNQFFTHMNEVFSALAGEQKEYNWLLSDYDCNIYPSKKIPFNKQYVWIDGSELTDVVDRYDMQFIWGVFSGFHKTVCPEDALKYGVTYANGNKSLWEFPIRTQNPLAEIEIVAWDSTVLLLRTSRDDLIQKLLVEYPEAIDLEEYCRDSC